MTTKFWPLSALILIGAWVHWAPNASVPVTPQGWRAVDTGFSVATAGETANYAQHLATISLVKAAALNGAQTVILPESAFGIWTLTSERLWVRELQGVDVVVNGGAIVLDQNGYDNVMVQVSAAGANILYRQRMPVPVSMWQPWTPTGANAHFFNSPVVAFRDRLIVPLICYELLLTWPVLHSMLFAPKVIVATGNGWWTEGTNIVAIQMASIYAWARLFDLPALVAINHPAHALETTAWASINGLG